MRGHLHPCVSCGAQVPCDGDYERNVDGWPEVICTAYHLSNGLLNPDCLCEPCREQADKEDAEAQADRAHGCSL